nr:taste receptor type 1 member 2-like [Misgurnus anguillicaudatus]
MFSRHTFTKSGYKMFQVMRFAVEEINNSTTLLPNVSLGYDIFDHCSDTENFPSVFSFISQNGSIKPQEKLNSHQPKVIALIGPYGSTRAISVAPLATMDLIPLVNYGATSYTLSDKLQYPSFIRTIPSNKDLIQMIIHTIQWFGWNWVAFLGDPDSEEGLQLFSSYIRNTDICLAYQETLRQNSNYSLTLKNIHKLNINVIVVFTLSRYAKNIIKAAIDNNIRDKVWITSEAWSMNEQLLKEPGIKNIGTVIGMTERLLSLPGFNEFIYEFKATPKINTTNNNVQSKIQTKTCNQDCDNCTSLTAEDIINEESTLSFPIYAAIYTTAHALHNVLKCNMNECSKNTTVKPYMLLGEMKKLDFPLIGRQVKYDANGDSAISYAVVLWHTETNPPWIEMVGTYDTYPQNIFTINTSLFPWRSNVSVPLSSCSVECKKGFSRERVGYYDCCFLCKKCPQNSYVNYSPLLREVLTKLEMVLDQQSTILRFLQLQEDRGHLLDIEGGLLLLGELGGQRGMARGNPASTGKGQQGKGRTELLRLRPTSCVAVDLGALLSPPEGFLWAYESAWGRFSFSLVQGFLWVYESAWGRFSFSLVQGFLWVYEPLWDEFSFSWVPGVNNSKNHTSPLASCTGKERGGFYQRPTVTDETTSCRGWGSEWHSEHTSVFPDQHVLFPSSCGQAKI